VLPGSKLADCKSERIDQRWYYINDSFVSMLHNGMCVSEPLGSRNVCFLWATYKKLYAAHTAILLRLTIRPTNIARSPCRHSIIAKAMIMIPKPTNKPTEVFEFHGVVKPPFCNARQKHNRAPSSRTIPGKSNACKLLFAVLLVGMACFGALKKTRMIRNVVPPMGRLIQKLLSRSISLRGQYVSTSQSADGLYVPPTP
jgi:hypothetical protein